MIAVLNALNTNQQGSDMAEKSTMAEADKAFTGTVPEIYDRYLVPLIFEAYAKRMAHQVEKLDPSSLLETAAGTGVVTRAIAGALTGSFRLVATDLNQAMLDVAQAKLGDDDRIEWRQADALALPFDDQSFDVVVCQFGAMFFPDKLRAYGEARRVLRPNGLFLFSVWDDISGNEFADVVTASLAELFPINSPRFLPRTPHGYFNAEDIAASLRAAGFSEVNWETVDGVSRCNTPLDPALAYCQGTPLKSEILALDPARLDEATQHVAAALSRRFGPGPIEGRIRAVVFSARR